MAEYPSIVTVVSAMLRCDLVSVLFDFSTNSRYDSAVSTTSKAHLCQLQATAKHASGVARK